MKKSAMLPPIVLSVLCALLATDGRAATQADAASGPAGTTLEPSDEILPLVQFEDAPLVDVIQTLARQARLNIIIDPKVTAAAQTGKSIRAPVSIRLENTTAQKVLEALKAHGHTRKRLGWRDGCGSHTRGPWK